MPVSDKNSAGLVDWPAHTDTILEGKHRLYIIRVCIPPVQRGSSIQFFPIIGFPTMWSLARDGFQRRSLTQTFPAGSRENQRKTNARATYLFGGVASGWEFLSAVHTQHQNNGDIVFSFFGLAGYEVGCHVRLRFYDRRASSSLPGGTATAEPNLYSQAVFRFSRVHHVNRATHTSLKTTDSRC